LVKKRVVGISEKLAKRDQVKGLDYATGRGVTSKERCVVKLVVDAFESRDPDRPEHGRLL